MIFFPLWVSCIFPFWVFNFFLWLTFRNLKIVCFVWLLMWLAFIHIFGSVDLCFSPSMKIFQPLFFKICSCAFPLSPALSSYRYASRWHCPRLLGLFFFLGFHPCSSTAFLTSYWGTQKPFPVNSKAIHFYLLGLVMHLRNKKSAETSSRQRSGLQM